MVEFNCKHIEVLEVFVSSSHANWDIGKERCEKWYIPPGIYFSYQTKKY